jgi:hypothetical protein
MLALIDHKQIKNCVENSNAISEPKMFPMVAASLDPALRDELLQACRASGGTVHAVVQAIVDTLMVWIIAVAPNVDAAEADIRNITQCMRENIRKSYAEFHDMAAAQRGTRQ